MLSVESDSPEADELYRTLASPALAVYGDGRVIWSVGTRNRQLAVLPILPGWEPCPA